jgi:hypothetical protein
VTALPYISQPALVALAIFFAYLVVFAGVAMFFSIGAHRDDIFRFDHSEPTETPSTPSPGGRSMHQWIWQAYCDDSEDHRDPTDPDVAAVICVVRHDAELDRLDAAHRDLRSLWEPT